MSRWNKPMRVWRSPSMACAACGQPARPSQYGGWEHVRRIGIKDPAWHQVAEVVEA